MNDAFNQEVRYRLLKVLSNDASLTQRDGSGVQIK